MKQAQYDITELVKFLYGLQDYVIPQNIATKAFIFYTTDEGVFVKPTLSFDERGHQVNDLTYFVTGLTGKGETPVGFCPVVEDFTGEGENLLHPYTKALYKALPANGFNLTKGHQPLHGEIPNGCPYYDRCEMRFDRCKDERPELIDLGKKKVRCFKYEEGA